MRQPLLVDVCSERMRRAAFRLPAVAVVAALAALAACGGAGSPAGPSSTESPAPSARVHVTLDVTRALRTVDSGRILGGNLAAWVAPSQLAPPTGQYVVDRGARVLRFPGGNLANTFCWVSMRASDKNMVQWDDWSWGTGIVPYLAFVGSVGGEPMYTLNPFDHVIDGQTHSAVAEARALVRLLVASGYAGAFYEIGNENDGSWNPMLSPPEYVERFVTLGEAVKGEDPSARLLGPVGSGIEASWRDGFIDGLAARGKLPLLDYFDFHYYGGWISNSNTAGIDLAGPQQIPGYVKAIRDKLSAAGGPGIGVALTEYNAAIWDTGATRGQYTIEQGLWLADAAAELFGCVDLADVWIDLTADDPHGLLTDRTVPPSRTKNYWPMYLVGRTLGLGRRDSAVDVLDASSDLATSRATVHAVRGRDGSLGILLVNKGDALTAQVALAGRNCSTVSALRIDGSVYAAASGPLPQPASCSGSTLTVDLPGLSAVGIVLGP
jgi:hypothetical protein